MEVMLGEGNSNSIERELENVINGPEGLINHMGRYRTTEKTHLRNSKNVSRNTDRANEALRKDRFQGSLQILSDEIN